MWLAVAEGSVAEMSSRGVEPCPAAFAETVRNSSSTGLSAVPNLSGRLGPFEVRSSEKSLAPFGLMVPAALPEIFSPESVTWSMTRPPAVEARPAASRSRGPSPARRVWLVSAPASLALN